MNVQQSYSISGSVVYPQPNYTRPLPKLSIVTPSFNQGTFLESTIQSVLSQGYPDLEYVVIDGGSTDESVDIIRKYAPYLHYWCSEPDGGQYDAINKGFRYCSGEIMAWLNSDDIYFPWTLRTVGSIMSDLYEVSWLTTLLPGGLDRDGFCSGIRRLSGVCSDAFLDGMFLSTTARWFGWLQQESTFWRRSLWEKIGAAIPTSWDFAGDFALWTKFVEYADLFGVDIPLAGFRFHPIQKTNQGSRYTAEAASIFEAMTTRRPYLRSRLKRVAKYLRFNDVPLLRRITRKTLGYRGKLVALNDSHKHSTHWCVKERRFI